MTIRRLATVGEVLAEGRLILENAFRFTWRNGETEQARVCCKFGVHQPGEQRNSSKPLSPLFLSSSMSVECGV